MKKHSNLIIIFCFLVFGCQPNNQKFDSEKWAPYESGVIGGERKKMLFDLTRNILKPNLTTKKQVDSLLGKHNYIHALDSSFVYDVYEKYGWNIDPEGYIKLKLIFSKDSILQQWTVEDTVFNP